MSCVVTTINNPTLAIERLHDLFGSNLLVVGDKKTPKDWNYKDAVYCHPESEVAYAPINHYARKNLGYLEAIRRKSKFIYDTDDDNVPSEHWKERTHLISAYASVFDGWYNVYDLLEVGKIWPRGFPLNKIRDHYDLGNQREVVSPIQQGLANGDPDVDAIFRLVLQKEPIYFKHKASIYLKPGAWCPFNSQSTWWFPVAYPLLYLPINCSFRMTDIWRSFVAQRCLWELDMGVTFHSPAEVYQSRNEHDLMADFKDEIDGYLKNELIVETLQNLELKKGQENICNNMLTCYEAMIGIGVLPQKELIPLLQWIKDYEQFK